MYTLPICFAIFLFMLFIFRSFPFALLISLAGVFYPRFIILGLIKKRRRLLNNQLKEAMFSLVSSLRAGASLQTAIERCVQDLENIFSEDKDAPIVREFQYMVEELQMGYTVDEVLHAFRDRVHLEDVTDFVNATLIAKKRGGNLTEILVNISKVISEKIEISNEIQVLTAGKQMEARMLSIMPVFIVGCLTLLSPEYMEAMYDSWVGKLLLFVGFILILINYWISRKIVDIHV
ncbi:tight adherence protein B [Paenibacillus qinlingensis]|uniref:Tight adherence protein B n=2 Tax=Paenibacillus qinlingensis TaxID=1837343 RepID=A0ABU1NVR3_9BACL|nr:tight adherence protein B [Paenibacillus qinlingensis]